MICPKSQHQSDNINIGVEICRNVDIGILVSSYLRDLSGALNRNTSCCKGEHSPYNDRRNDC